MLGTVLPCRRHRMPLGEYGVTSFYKAARSSSFPIGGKWWIGKPGRSKSGVSFGSPCVAGNRSVTVFGCIETKARSGIPALCAAETYGVVFFAPQRFCADVANRLARFFAPSMQMGVRQSW